MAKTPNKTNKPAKKRKPIFNGFFKEIQALEKDGDLENLSSNKIKKLSSLLSSHLNSYNANFNTRLSNQVHHDFRKAYIDYGTTGFLKNNKGLKGWRLNKLKPKLKASLRERITNALLLITTQNSARMAVLSSRFLDWLGSKNNNSTNKKSLQEAMQVSQTIAKKDKHFKMILGDQTRKLLTNFDNIVAEEYNAIAFIWKTRRDNRVTGNPTGKNPKGNDMHGDHYDRQDKLYFFHNSWVIRQQLINTKHKDFRWADFKDGMPGQPINCRCYAYNIYELHDIPKTLLTESGKKYLVSKR